MKVHQEIDEKFEHLLNQKVKEFSIDAVIKMTNGNTLQNVVLLNIPSLDNFEDDEIDEIFGTDKTQQEQYDAEINSVFSKNLVSLDNIQEISSPLNFLKEEFTIQLGKYIEELSYNQTGDWEVNFPYWIFAAKFSENQIFNFYLQHNCLDYFNERQIYLPSSYRLTDIVKVFPNTIYTNGQFLKLDNAGILDSLPEVSIIDMDYKTFCYINLKKDIPKLFQTKRFSWLKPNLLE